MLNIPFNPVGQTGNSEGLNFSIKKKKKKGKFHTIKRILENGNGKFVIFWGVGGLRRVFFLCEKVGESFRIYKVYKMPLCLKVDFCGPL